MNVNMVNNLSRKSSNVRLNVCLSDCPLDLKNGVSKVLRNNTTLLGMMYT